MKIMKYLSLVAVVMLLVSCNKNGVAQKPIKTELDSVSYAIGMDVAKNVKASFDDFDNDYEELKSELGNLEQYIHKSSYFQLIEQDS